MKLTADDMPTKRIISVMETGKGFDISELNWLSAQWADLDFLVFVREATLFFYSVVPIPLENQDAHLQELMEAYTRAKDAT